MYNAYYFVCMVAYMHIAFSCHLLVKGTTCLRTRAFVCVYANLWECVWVFVSVRACVASACRCHRLSCVATRCCSLVPGVPGTLDSLPWPPLRTPLGAGIRRGVARLHCRQRRRALAAPGRDRGCVLQGTPPFLRVMVLNLCPGMQLHYTFWLLLTLVPTATDAPTATDSPAADIAAGAVGTPDAGSDGAARAGVVVWPHRRPPGFPSRQLRRRSFPPDPRGLFPGRSLRRWRGQPAHGGG